MALEPQTARLCALVRDRVDAGSVDAYLSELRVLELADGRVVIAVGATLEREVARRFGGTLVAACGDLFSAGRVVLAGASEALDLTAGVPHPGSSRQRAVAPPGGHRTRPVRRLRQRAGPSGQPGIAQRLEAQQSFRVPFAIAAGLPRTATQAFGRHNANEPLEYVGRWGRARSETSLTAFHHRLLLGMLRLAQAGCLTDQGTTASVNLLLLAAEGKGSRELPVARDQVLPALMDLLMSRATHTAHHRAEHTGEPYIADRRRLDRPIIDQVLVRTAADPGRLVPLAKIMEQDPAGRFRQTRSLARGGGMSILIVFADWVLDTLHAPTDRAGSEFVVLDTETFLGVRSRRLFTWLAVQTAPVNDPKAQLPPGVPRAPQNTSYKRIDLNHVSVRDLGRHGHDPDRITADITEDLNGEHGIAQIDRRVHSVHTTWNGTVCQLWVCVRHARELPHRGQLPRRLHARARWARRSQPPIATRPRRRADAHQRPTIPTLDGDRVARDVPLIVGLARSQTATGDDIDSTGAPAKRTAGASLT